MTVGVWFRNDLRVHDNPALYNACRSNDSIIAIYLHTPEQWREHGMGLNRQRFLVDNLMCLSRDLAKLRIPLLAVTVGHFDDCSKALEKLCREQNIVELHFNEEYELNELRRDTQVFTTLTHKKVAVWRHQDQVLQAPGSVLTAQGQPFRVYTPFKRSWLRQVKVELTQPFPVPAKRRNSATASTPLEQIEHWVAPQPANTSWIAGSKEAFRRLDQFTAQCIETYDDQRNFPALDGTSRLSPYLSVGAISVRSCFHAALNANRHEWDSGSSGIQTWINELIWREFYKHLSFNFPDLCKGKPFQPHTVRIPWQRNVEVFAAWCEGRTGYPIVDAAMRQLIATGWMHNRLRMVVAMFLTKHLFIDWRWGEAFFLQHLIDGDFSANNGGWQWSASTGADAAPYFRVFNPLRQAERFDGDGSFVRHWLPELADLPSSQIHDPSPLERQMCGYPAPIVDHRAAVERVKTEFQNVKTSEYA